MQNKKVDSDTDLDQGIENFLQKEIINLNERKTNRQKVNKAIIITSFVFIIIAILAGLLMGTYNNFFVIVTAAYSLVFLLSPLIRQNTEFDNRIQQLNEELDLLKIGKESIELRAEKQFKVHQSELKRYYDQSLKHGSWIFYIGILNLIIGVGIIVLAMYLISQNNSDNNSDKILIGIIGGVAGILTNFIAAIYLRMYSGQTKSLNEFHNRLVYTNHLHYSNFLISKIYDEKLRSETWAALALSLPNRYRSSSNEDQSSD